MNGQTARDDGTSSAGRAVWLALGTIVASSYAIQVHTFAGLKLAILESRRAGGAGLPPLPRDALSVCAAAAFVAALLLLVVLEIRGRRVSRVLRDALGEVGPRHALLVVVALLAVRSYCDAGVPHAFDAKQHYAKVAAVSDLLGDGEWPRWTWRWYGGFPLLRFYGPVLYLLAGGLGTALGSASLGLKVVLVALHAGSGWAAYAWVRRWSGSRGAATGAAIAYLLVPQRFHTLLLLGRLPEAVLYLLFPLLLLCIERFAARGARRDIVATGAVLAAMLMSHPMMGALGGVLGGVYALARLVPERAWRARPLAIVTFGAGAGVLAAGLAAVWLVPAFTERPYVLLGEMYGAGPGAFVPGLPSARNLGKLLLPDPSWGARSSVAYAGLSLLALTSVALVRGWRTERARAWPLLATLALALLYAGGSYFQARAVAFLALVLSAGAGWALASLVTSGRARRAALLALLVLLDLLPFSVKSPFRPGLEGVQNDLTALARSLGGSKAIVVSARSGAPEISQWTGWDESRLFVLGGPFREGATALYPWHMAVLARVREDLRDGGLDEPLTIAALRLHGVGAVVAEDGTRLVPLGRGRPVPGLRLSLDPPALLVEDSAPALFAPSVSPVTGDVWTRWSAELPIFDVPPPFTPWALQLDELLALQEIRTDSGYAGRLLLATDGTGTEPQSDAWPPPRVTSVRADHLRVELAVEARSAGHLLLPFADYPGVRVRVDGAAVPHGRSVQGACVVAIEPGQHTVELLAPRGPERTWGRWLGLVALLLAVGVWFAPSRRREPTRP